MSELAVIAIIVLLGVVLVVGGLVASRRSGRVVREPSPGVTPSAGPAVDPAVEPAAEQVVRPPGRARLRDRIGTTRAALAGAFVGFSGRAHVDPDTWDQLEEALILADVGVPTTTRIVAATKARVKAEAITDADGIGNALRVELRDALDGGGRGLRAPAGKTNVWLFVGVNGVGKTTTIAKLAQREIAAGHSVILAAADTFRAAAAEQLERWAERVGADLVRAQEGADPGSVVFDAMSAAKGRGADLVLIDTAGRLHTKVNLMAELEKLGRIVDRTPGALEEVLLVIDASTGQNGLAQARQFAEAVAVTGVVLTKLDGTAKGGIVFAIQSELDIPVKVVGVGETADDLMVFDPDEFVDALFD